MRYTVVTANSSDDLIERVNERITQGWRPLGGVAVAVSDWADGEGNAKDYWEFAQAMAMDEN